MSVHRTDPARRTPRSGGPWPILLVAAVVAVLAVVAALLLGTGPDGGSEEGTSTQPSASGTGQTEPARPSPSGRGGTFDLLGDVVDGAPLSTPYLADEELVAPQGSTVRLPHHYDAFTLLGDQVVASYDDAGERTLDVLTDTGTRVHSSSLASDFAVDGTGGVAAWATAGGEVVTRWTDGQLSFGNQGGPVTVAAVLGRAPCRARGDTCRVFVNNVDGRPPQSVTADGSVTAVAPGAIKVNDVRADGLTAVQLSSSDTGSCSGVYDARRGAYLWRTCRNSLLQFSPKGSYLLATDPYLDGLGLSTLSVLEARTGDVLATYVIRGGFIAQETWEDDSHPLVVLSGPDGWEVLRLGLDGTRERALGPVPADKDPTRQLLTLPRR